MNKTFYILAISAISFLSIPKTMAQERTKARTLSLKLSPFSLLTGYAEIAGAYYLTDRWSFELRYGHHFNSFYPSSSDVFKTSAFKAFGEIQAAMPRSLVFSLELGISGAHDTDSMRYFLKDEFTDEIMDGFDFKEVRFSITPKVILIFYTSHRFQLEGYAGIGWKRCKRTVFNLEFDPSTHVDLSMNESFFSTSPYQEALWISARVALGLNFCYLIRSSR